MWVMVNAEAPLNLTKQAPEVPQVPYVRLILRNTLCEEVPQFFRDF